MPSYSSTGRLVKALKRIIYFFLKPSIISPEITIRITPGNLWNFKIYPCRL